VSALALGAEGIAALIPHQGAMCLLDGVVAWDRQWIDCRAVSHLRLDNPLRREGKLGLLAGIEYAMQATAVHGALLAGARRGPAYLAVLREVGFGGSGRLDEAGHEVLRVQAWLERGDAAGFIYRFDVGTEGGVSLIAGRAAVAMKEKQAVLF
jgi:predicted hotdog family 3-hydroxylacyl-ACP dehydratase